VRHSIAADELAYHPLLGWVHDSLPNPELGINEDGFRHAPVSKRKPAGTWRAFAIGDSQTMGSGVAAHESWPAVAEDLLRQRTGGGPEVELINAAVAGYTSLHALRLIRLRLLDWDPDLIILDSRTFDSPRDDITTDSASGAALGRLAFHSRMVWAIELGLGRHSGAQGREAGPEGLLRPASELEDRFGNHALIAELLRRHGVRVLFLDYPFHKVALGGDTMAALAPSHELPPGEALAETVPALTASGFTPDELTLDLNHLSVEGNAVVGGVVAETILEEGLLVLE